MDQGVRLVHGARGEAGAWGYRHHHISLASHLPTLHIS